MRPTRSIRNLVRPRKTVLVAFGLLGAILAQHVLFKLLFPDGGASSIRAVLDALLEVLMVPLVSLRVLFEPMLEYGYFPGPIGIPLLIIYFYLLAVVMASSYETIVARGRQNDPS